MQRSLLILTALWLALSGCTEDHAGADSRTAPVPKVPAHPGKALHDRYCGTCHMLTDPSDLDRTTWQQSILVRMSAYMGIYNDNVRYYDRVPEKWLEPGEGGQRVRAAGIYPEKPMLTRQEWEKLREYVLHNAPAATQGPPGLDAIEPVLHHFRVRPLRPDTALQPFVTSVEIDAENRRLYAGLLQQAVLEMDPDGKVLDRYEGLYGPVFIRAAKGRLTLADIGDIKGSDQPKGRVKTVRRFADLGRRKETFGLDFLQRPVFVEWADLDGDGDEDAVVCEFGYHLGELAWHEDTGDGWKRHTLFPDDGAVSVAVHDFNDDSLPDILALMANADERLDLYLNQGDGTFRPQRLLRFNPTYGSTALELVDFNKDGLMDFLIANGDNGDYPPILKPHHGIRLYLNRDSLRFEEAFYLPMNGAYGMRTRDYDLDGDYDVAAVSFYPDYDTRMEEAFIFFENEGMMQFRARTFPQSDLSRWMVMDAGDLDGDGDEDIVLGGFNVKSDDASDSTYAQWMRNDVPVLLLENTVR